MSTTSTPRSNPNSGYWRTAWPFWAVGVLLIAGYSLLMHLILSESDDRGHGLVTYWLAPLSRQWFLVVPIVIFYLGISGLLGRGVGIQHLFRNRPTVCDRFASGRNSYAFWSAFGATLLVFEVGFIVAISEAWRNDSDSLLFGQWTSWFTEHQTPVISSEDDRVREMYNPLRAILIVVILLATAMPFLIVLGVIAAVPVPAVNAPPRTLRDCFRDSLLYTLGSLTGVVALILGAVVVSVVPNGWVVLAVYLLCVPYLLCLPFGPMLVIAIPIIAPIITCLWTVPGPTDSLYLISAQAVVPYALFLLFACTLLRRWKSVESLILAAIFVGLACIQYFHGTRWFQNQSGVEILEAFWLYVGIVTAVFIGIRQMPVLVPALCMKMVLTWIVALYAIFLLMRPELRILCGLLLVIWLVVANNSSSKYRFPGLDHYYSHRNMVPDSSPVHSSPVLWGDLDALKAWRGSHPFTSRPKLVIVGVSGGAYRASFWVSSVLDALTARIDDFHRHVRLISGASGGMVGAAYFAKYVNDSVKLYGASPPRVVDGFAEETNYDSLRPVAQRLFQHDIPKMFAPLGHQKEDRGIILERCWPTLAKTFLELYSHEETGGCPSVIFSPMLVETGQRLLISNLDLGHLISKADGGRMKPSALEFFKLFPKAREDFLVQTAVRMQATFPYLSPAVCIPTDPPLRVVDGGYFDNYGVNLAMTWAAYHRDWIVENTSGVAFVQIRAFTHASPVQLPGPLARSLHWLTSPLDGADNARGFTMKYRNDEQVEQTMKSYREKMPGFPFETFVFENEAEFAMNWFIDPNDVTLMQQELLTGKARQEVHRLADWWSTNNDDDYVI